jgi:hypothetical protein
MGIRKHTILENCERTLKGLINKGKMDSKVTVMRGNN